MISSVRFFVRNTCQRNIRTYHNIAQINKNRESRMLNKMFTKANRKKKNLGFQAGSLSKLSPLESNTDGNKKAAALNKVYMEHMTELIQTGYHSAKILNEGLEITDVKLTKAGDFVNIYWACQNESLTEEKIAKMLELAAKELQEQVGNLRYVARTPYVRFVRDVKMERAQIVERLLKIADFGESYEPTHPESVITPDCDIDEDGLPKMRQNLLGVDHARIKAKLLTAIEIYKVTHTPKENEFAYMEMENLIPFDKRTFEKFYKRKRILDRKLTSRGLLGWGRSSRVEEEEEEKNEDEDYAKELWESIKKEQEEEEKEFATDYQE